jgi:hypothetical protein
MIVKRHKKFIYIIDTHHCCSICISNMDLLEFVIELSWIVLFPIIEKNQRIPFSTSAIDTYFLLSKDTS